MPAQLKKLNTYNKPFWRFILSPKRIAFLAIAAFIFTGFLALRLQTKVFATTGINQTINFQGKVVNKDGTNVADGQYTFVFKIYDASSGGSNLWTETQNNVQVTAGIFRVSLGSVTPISGVDFNTDNIYLGINFNSDGEMTPRVRFASVPYAFNAQKVAGLTVTDTTGTLTIPNSKVVQFGGAFQTSAQDLILSLSGSTNVTLPTSGTLATLGGTENLSNKTFTSTVTVSGVTTDITTGSNEVLTVTPNGTGNVLINPSAGGQAALIVDKNGLGDIFSASASGTTKFVIASGGSLQLAAGAGIDAYSTGALSLGNGSNTSSLTLGRATAGITLPGFDCSGSGNGGKLTTTSGGVLTCSADGGGAAGDNFWQYKASTGVIAPGNLTAATLFGSTASNSALMRIAGTANSGTVPVASISANTSFAGFVIDNTGVGDLFAASKSGLTKFVITNSGNVGVGTILPTMVGGLFNSNGTNLQVRGNDGVNNSAITVSGKTQSSIYLVNETGATDNKVIQFYNFNGRTALRGLSDTGGLFLNATDFLAFDNATGKVGLGMASGVSPTSELHVTRPLVMGATGKALAIFDQIENQDIFAASSSGTTKFVIKNDGTASTSGNLVINSAGSLQTTNYQKLTLGGSSTGDIVLMPRNGSGFVGINNASPAYPLDLLSTTNPQVRFGYDTSNYMTLAIGSSGVTTFDAVGSGAAFNFKDSVSLGVSGASNGILQFNNSAGGTAASITTNASGDLILQSSGGIVNLGVGSGDITIDPGTNNIVANLTSGNFLGQKNGVNLITFSTSGTFPVASFSGTTSFAGLLVDNSGVGDLITASTSGLTRFTVTRNGTASSSAGFTVDANNGNIQSTKNQSLTIGGGSTGELTIGRTSQKVWLPGFDCSGSGNGGKLTTTSGGILTCAADTSGAGGGDNWWQLATGGVLAPGNLTAATLFGSTASNSALMTIAGTANSGTVPVASISANTSFAGMVVDNAGLGDLFTASKSGLTKFVIKQNGNVGIGRSIGANPLGFLDISNDGTNSISGITFSGSYAGSSDTFIKFVPSSVHATSIGLDFGSIPFTLIKDTAIINSVANVNMLDFSQSSGMSGGNSYGTNVINIANTAALSSGVASITGNYLNFGRTPTVSGGTLNLTGDLATITANCTQSGGTCVDTSNLLSLIQNFGKASGAVLDIVNNGIGSAAAITSNSGGQAAVIINKTGASGDILTASVSGVTKFNIAYDGTASSSAGFTIDGNGGVIQSTRNQSLTIGGGLTGELTIGRTSQRVFLPGFDCSGSGNGGKLTTTSGGVLTCAADGGSAGAAGTWTLDAVNGVHTPINNTADLLVGGTSTQSAMFSVLGLAAGTNPSASVSAINGANANKGVYISGDGSLQSVRNNFLTIGGNTTGDIYLKPLNGSGMVRIIHGTTGTGGLILGDSETDATQKVARLKSIPYNSASSLPITMLIAINSSSGNVLNIGGGSGSEYAVTGIYFKTATDQTTATGTNRLYVGGASGFVGIGDNNTTPVARLDILDDATDINGEKLVLRRTGAGDVGMSFQQNGISAFGIVNRSGVGSGLAFVDNYYEGSNGTEIARFYASAGVGIGTLGNTPTATLDVRGAFTDSGILPLGRFTGTTSFAGLAINNSGVGELFTASSSGITRFTISNTGAIGLNGSYGALGQCLLSNGVGSGASWGGCAAGAAGGWFNLISSQGTIVPVNQTLDLLWGGNSTSSAGFRIAGATKNYGTVAAASVSANTSFAGFVIDNRGSGELLTASSSGATRFTIYNSGNVVIGSGPDSGFKLDVKGSVRIGNNTATDDIVKDSSTDFTQSGYSITTNDSVNTVSTSENQIKLVTDLIGAGASLTAPAADQTTGANVTTGSVAFQRPDKKFVVFVGGAATSKIYDTTTGTWTAGPNSANSVSLGAGARAFQRQNGSFLVIHGGGATSTTVYSPGGSANFGTAIAGPATTAAVGAGSLVIRRPDGKVLLIHGNTGTTTSVHDPVTATGATSIIGSFITGPATTGNVTTGSFAFQKPDGKWIVGLGGGTTTNLYDPSSSGVGGGGAFSAGPSLTTGTPGAGTHVIQLPDGRFMVLIGGSGATQIYDWKSNSFSVGPSLATDTLGAGAHSFQRSDGKWIVVVGGTSKNLQLYDPTSGANGSFSQLTGANGLQGATGAGAGAFTIQRPDGKYIVVHGNTTQLTTLYDAGWNTTGTWTSEDILNTKISTYSAMIWSANPQSANNNARLDSETINIAVKTGDTLISLGNNPYRTLQDSGDLIKAYGNAQYAKIQVTFSVPVRSYPSGVTANIAQTNIWDGEGGTFLRRSFIQPTVFSMRIQNPLVSYGDPSGQGDPAFGRNFATASAQLEGVVTDNSNRLSLSTLRNLPTATASAGFIIASASANLGGNAGAGAHTIERNNGQFLTILGNSLTTTRLYDSDTNTWSAGPDLPNAAGAGAHSFLLPDGRFFVVLGGTTNKTAIFDPQANLFQTGPTLFGNVGIGANTFQRPDGFFVILNGGATAATNILDPFTMAVTQGPFTTGATPNVGAGAMNIRRPDGRILIILGNGNAVATSTNIYDPASNSFAAGPAMVGTAPNTGGNAIQLNTGRIMLFKPAATTNWLDPILNTFAAGPTTITANGAGSFLIPRSDGKILKANGAAATTNVIDPAAGTAVTGTSAPTLPCTVNTGGHVFQRPTGEYVAICGGGTASTFIVDAGWNLGGTYTTEQIQVPNLSSTSSLFWRNVGQGSITVKYRTASSQQALGVASWKDLPQSGSYISPAAGDTWLQARFDLQGALQDLPGAKTRVWTASDSGGGMVYYRAVQTPILEYWKLVNIQDPTLLTLSSGGSNAFRFASDGQAYTSDMGAWNSGGADLAERYQSQDALEAGEVVSLDRLHSQNTKRSTLAYDQNAMGVVSTQPGFVAGAYTENSYPIALVGRVPVKVSTENGEIHAGDYLASASIPGYAMKATVAGRVIGQAMEDLTADQVQECPKFGAGNLTATKCGTITVFVNLTSYNGESVEVAMKDKGFALKEEELPAISGMDFAAGTDARRQQEVLGFLKTQKDNGQAIYTDRVAATQEVISPQIVTDLLVAKKIKAESIEGLEIITNSIESLSNQLATGSAVTSFSDRLNLLALNQQDFETQMSSLSAKLDKMSSLNILSFIAQGSTSGELTMVNNLASYGTTTLSEASIMNTLTIGTGSTLTLSENSLYTLGDDLSIQPFRQGGVNFLGGLIKFDTDGKATFGKDVTFAKNVGVAGVLSAKTVSSTELQLGQGTTTVVSDTEVTATAAAGLVILKKNTDHVKVNNPLVRDNSFIFITPKTKTTQQLFLLDQNESTSFTVGVDGKAEADIKFNYLIVN